MERARGSAAAAPWSVRASVTSSSSSTHLLYWVLSSPSSSSGRVLKFCDELCLALEKAGALLVGGEHRVNGQGVRALNLLLDHEQVDAGRNLQALHVNQTEQSGFTHSVRPDEAVLAARDDFQGCVLEQLRALGTRPCDGELGDVDVGRALPRLWVSDDRVRNGKQ